MDNFDPADIPLPQIIDPILAYLSSVLPPQVYSILLTVASHALALITSFASLSWTLIQSRPWEWEAQTLIPLVITILSAYLALLSAWRTASWMVRTSVWFLKWGTIFATLAAGLGWVAGGAGGEGGLGQPGGGGAGIMSMLSGLFMDAMNGQNQNAAGGTRRPNTRTRNKDTQSQAGSRGTRPKSWESFQQHDEWRYQENANNGAGAGDLSEVLQSVMGSVMGSGGWVDTAKNVWESVQNAATVNQNDEDQDDRGRRTQPPRQAKTKAQGRSR